MIEPGLARISRLLQHIPLPWRAVHVAGTNGKGSICAYTSAMLHSAGVRAGRFTSPHLIDRWDCISIDEKPVSAALFRDVEARVRARDVAEDIGASEFELLTAVGFELFTDSGVDVGVVEVGLGGRLDATNILGGSVSPQHSKPLVTVISKIGHDHHDWLGESLEEIAWHKAGILKPGVPCVVDASNVPEVLSVVEKCAREVGAAEVIHVKGEPTPPSAPYQPANLACSVRAVQIALDGLGVEHSLSKDELTRVAMKVVWPGRLQTMSIKPITGRQKPILLDGAHNQQSIEALATYIQDSNFRRPSPEPSSITWVVGFSRGKDIASMLRLLLKPGDNVVAVEFGPVDGMPWVKPMDANVILQEVKSIQGEANGELLYAANDIQDALQRATDRSGDDGALVVAGSLYLIGDVLRLLRDAESLSQSNR